MQCKYDYIAKFNIKVKCVQPIHIGSSDGTKGEILIDKFSNTPFIQATSLAGAMGEYLARKNSCLKNSLFGKSNVKNNDNTTKLNKSKIIFTNAEFIKNTIKLERRPRVKINPETSTVFEEHNSGQKFEIENIGKGAEFVFSISLVCYQNEKDDFLNAIKDIIKAIDCGDIIFGGQKTNGYGKVAILDVLFDEFYLKNANDLKRWLQFDNESFDIGKSILEDIKELIYESDCYDIIFKANADNSVIIKSISSIPEDDKSPDAISIKNAEGKFIVPGSSFKGVLKSRIETIAKFKNIDLSNINCIFGQSLTEEFENGVAGKVTFFDTEFKNSKSKISNRIKIDKFTGGTINNALFNEESVCGNLEFHIKVPKFELQKMSIAFILLALRDLSVGAISIGGEASIGYGFLNAEKIQIKSLNDIVAEIDIKEKTVTKGQEFISDSLQALKVV